MRLREKLLFIVVPLILLPIILAGSITYIYSQSAKKDLENAKLDSDIYHGVNEVSHLTRSVASAVRYLSYSHVLSQALQQPNRENLASAQVTLAEFANAFEHTLSLRLLSLNGAVLTSHTKPEVANAVASIGNDLDLDWRLIMVAEREEPLVEINWGLYQVQGDRSSPKIGVLKVIICSNLIDYLKLNSAQGDRLIIKDLQRQTIFSFPATAEAAVLPDHLSEQLFALADQDTALETEINGQQGYFKSRLLADKYLLILGQNRAQYQQQEITLSWLLPLVIAISVLAVSALIIICVNKLIIEPISSLTNAKQEVAQGNLDVALEVNSKDEIAELFSSFNVMVKQLEAYREKEHDSRLQLEYKVKERTEDLEQANSELAQANGELEQAKQLSEQANQLKTAFVANMSHEIRTPLTAILGFTEQVIADSPRTPEQLDLLGRVLKSGKHLLSLINNILNLSKIESGKIELEVSRFDLFDLFNDVVNIMSNQAAEGQLDFQFNYHYPLPRQLNTDSTRLRQVLFNLASNAIKFTEKGSVKIDVSFIAKSKLIQVKVVDTGIGMSQSVLDYIFQPFTQADLSISRRFGGTGLGLVISRSYARLLGGDIVVDSTLGKGSEFIFTFATSAHGEDYQHVMVDSLIDLAHSEDSVVALPKNPPAQQQQQPEPLRGGRVLVAEDVEDNQYLIKMLLKNLGVEFVIVSNGEQAVEQALADEFDLILMDMQMPVMGGLEATELLRAAGVATPIYALTANVMKEDTQQHQAAGCDGTIAKPINRNEFKQVVCRILQNKVANNAEIIQQQVLQQLRQKYVAQLPQQVKVLNTCLTDQNALGLVSELHKIKGTAGSYGFTLLSQMSADLESQFKQAQPQEYDWTQVQSQLDVLTQTIGNICHAQSSKR